MKKAWKFLKLAFRAILKKDKYYPNVGRSGNRGIVGNRLKTIAPSFTSHWLIDHWFIVLRIILEKIRKDIRINGYKNNCTFEQKNLFIGTITFQPLKR